MDNGWIKLHRKIQKHWVYQDAEYLKAWITILIEVNIIPQKTLIRGSLLTCDRGEKLYSISTWADKFGPSWTVQKVRTFFKALEDDGMINRINNRQTTRLIVCNYNDLQDQITKPDDNSQQTANTVATTIKEVKEVKKEKKTPEPLYTEDSPPYRLSINLWKSIIDSGSTASKPDFQKWSDDFDKIHRIDNRPWDFISQIMGIAREDSFWVDNIKCPSKLRQALKKGSLDRFLHMITDVIPDKDIPNGL